MMQQAGSVTMAKRDEPQALQRALGMQREVVDDFLAPQNLRRNVVGLGVGEKLKGGRPTGELALMALVTHKEPDEVLSDTDRVPANFGDIPTDVVEVGYPVALAAPPRSLSMSEAYTPYPSYPASVTPALTPDGRSTLLETGYVRVPMTELEPTSASPLLLARRVRPVKGGYSVGHFAITAGTIATCVYDMLPGGSVSPPAHGVGIPPKFYILSNNHVLANSNAASAGDPILQPGPIDGGTLPADRIASLSRFVPITFEPPIPRAQHRNLVDAAIAEASFHDLDREIHWLGTVRGWRRKAAVTVGTLVKKVGRTTNFTVGRITAIAATVDVGYGGGVARFSDQIVTTNISAGGDSGSLVTTLDNVAVGLLFAGSSVATIVNQIENVRALLRIEVSEQIL
jgi:hypothetical protein